MRSQAAADAAEEAAVHQPSAAGRRKGTASRSWLVVSASGRTNMEEVGKHSIMRRTGLPARDLRVLDPLLSYPSTILGRERAIVINLLHIKAIITAAEVLVSNPKGQLVEAFVDELRSRLAGSGHLQDLALSDMEAGKTTSFPPSSTGNNGTKHAMKISDEHPTSPTNGETVHSMDGCKDGGTKVLSFEFRALEVCLESACMCLESETLSLEQEAYPALDELTSKISTLNLQRVREIKNRLVAISGRVQKVRDEIEHLLDDDMDMAEMFLTEKLLYQPVGEASFRDDINYEAIDLDDNDEDKDEGLKIETESNRGSLAGFKPNIEELEMLLEAYFVQVDGTLNKLSTLREYVDDTEDYINIMLDEKQNQLLQMGVMLSTATLVVTAGVVVVGIFGMNIGIDLFNAPFFKFWVTTFGTIGGCVILYILAIGWGKKSGLLQ